MIELVWPWALALLPLPIMVRYLLPPADRNDAALRVPFYQQLAEIKGTQRISANAGKQSAFWLRLLLYLAWFSLVLAATKPQWIGDPISLPTSGRDLMIAVDISGSMKHKDLTLEGDPASRLAVVKDVLGEFIERRKGDRIGLILFGTQAYLQAPLTFDRKAVATLLDESEIGFAGQQTAIGDAIGLATKRLRSRPESSRVLILLTDGANTAGEIQPLKATEIAQAEKVRIHTIGVGAREMVVSSPFGGLFGKRTVNPSADLDEGVLQQIADQSGGRYFRAHDTQELQQIYSTLDQMEPIEQEAETFNPKRSLYIWPLALFFLFCLMIAAIRLYPSLAYQWSNRKQTEAADA